MKQAITILIFTIMQASLCLAADFSATLAQAEQNISQTIAEQHKIINQLINTANINVAKYEQELKTAQQKQLKLITEKDIAYTKLKAEIGKVKGEYIKRAGLLATQKQAKQDYEAAQRDYKNAKAAYDEEYEDYNNDGKWFGKGILTALSFGIYNAFDDLKDTEKRLDQMATNLGTIEKRINALKNEQTKLSENITKLSETIVSAVADADKYDQDMASNSQLINEFTVKKLYYSDLVIYFSMLKHTDNAKPLAAIQKMRIDYDKVNSDLALALSRYNKTTSNTLFSGFNGLIIAGKGDPLYFVMDGKAHWIDSPSSFNAVFVDLAWENVLRIPQSLMDRFAKGENISAPALVKKQGAPPVYFVTQGKNTKSLEHWIVSVEVFNNYMFDWTKIKELDSITFSKGANID
ncbi:MAG: hypothetical protein LBV04_01260 [Deferribacteraceae bacterium]|jgi:regulator of replication initiation timing|nr:hypothetical protein [Deferribacteraceae bacterium]